MTTVNLDNYVQLATRTESSDFPAIGERAGQDKMIRLQHAAIGIATEGGELLDQLKRHIFYGQEFDEVNYLEELGDLMWYIAIACDACGADLQSVMQANINKLSKRYPDKFTSEDALNRDLDTERETLDSDLT